MGIVLRQGKSLRLLSPRVRYMSRLSPAMFKWLSMYDRETGVLPTHMMTAKGPARVMESTIHNCKSLDLVYQKPSGRYVIKAKGIRRVERGG